MICLTGSMLCLTISLMFFGMAILPPLIVFLCVMMLSKLSLGMRILSVGMKMLRRVPSMNLESFLSGWKPTFLPKPPAPKRERVRGKAGAKATRIITVADFETTTKADDCRVWSWGFCEIETPMYDDVIVGANIDSFMDRLDDYNTICYFHNLKFDGNFIVYWLLTNGYEHSTDSKRKTKGTFKTLISDMGMWYSITIYWLNGHSTELRDSFKKLPMSVSRVAKSFKLEMSKGEIDYELERPVGWVMTPDEEDYLRRDVSIMAQAMKEVHDSGMKRLTVASDSMAEYKEVEGTRRFNRYFPLLGPDMDMEIRRAYRGGFTYADDRFKGRVVGGGIVLDVNSLYPSVMMHHTLPYGVPDFVRGKVEPTKTHPLTIFSVTFTAKLKPNHIPCIQIKGSNRFLGTEYLKEIEEPTTLMVTNVDWDLYNDHYDITVIAWDDGWRFRAQRGMFDDYINKWSEIKATASGGKREIAKLHLNSLYGKFASNPNVTSKNPVLKDGVVKLVRGESETRDPVYTAVGVFITAYARDITIRSAQANYDVFAYADTDSLHLLQPDVPESIEVHPTKLGAWKFEYAFENAYYIRPKAYLERLTSANEHNDECTEDCDIAHNYVNRIAGLPIGVSSVLTFDDLVEGKVLHGKLNPRAVPGGVILKDVPFELKLS